jgi:hypothetical protein
MRYVVIALLSMALMAFGGNVSAQTISVIVNSKVEVKEMTIQELQEVFTLKRGYWRNGSRVKIFIMPSDSITARRFIVEVLQLSPAMYFDLIESAYAMGKSNIPTTVPRAETVIIKVMITPGGIGYTDIPESKLNVDNVTVIKVMP